MYQTFEEYQDNNFDWLKSNLSAFGFVVDYRAGSVSLEYPKFDACITLEYHTFVSMSPSDLMGWYMRNLEASFE